MVSLSVSRRAVGAAAVVVGVALAAVLTECSGVRSALGVGSAAPDRRAQEIERLRAVLAEPAEPFSASLSVKSSDDRTSVEGQGTVTVSDVQTGATGEWMISGSAPVLVYTTTTRDAVYTQLDGGRWRREARQGQVLVADHRGLAQALLAADPASYRGPEQLRSGGTAYRLSGLLPVDRLSDALGVLRRRVTDQQIPQCTTDLLVDDRGRLSELSLTCEAGAYRAVTYLGLDGYGPPREVPPPPDADQPDADRLAPSS